MTSIWNANVIPGVGYICILGNRGIFPPFMYLISWDVSGCRWMLDIQIHCTSIDN